MVEVSHVDDTESVLRSVLNDSTWVQTDDFVGSDLLDGRARMLPGAFQFEANGPSVYRSRMLRTEHSVGHVRKRQDAFVFEFSVFAVRDLSVFDVVHSPEDEKKDVVGYAHSLVVYKSMPMDRSDPECKDAFKALRLRILSEAYAVHTPAGPIN